MVIDYKIISNVTLKSVVPDSYGTLTVTWEIKYRNGAVKDFILYGAENPFKKFRILNVDDDLLYYYFSSNYLAKNDLDDGTIPVFAYESSEVNDVTGPTAIEVTMKDIEKKFGRPVKIIKEEETK